MAVPVLHETDLFRPHEDPDDHWDLACQFALASRGLIDLKGVLIDYPPTQKHGEPDIAAVAQLSRITGQTVHVAVGLSSAAAPKAETALVRWLKETDLPVALHVVGSCRDLARCGQAFPTLFREKVRAVYLNAGAGCEGPFLEYNVALDPEAYAEIFRLPCPVYWMPCFHQVSADMQVGEFGTYYRFRQGRVLDRLKPEVQNYFLYMLSRRLDFSWLSALEAPVDRETLAGFADKDRNMWCTGGFLHAAGYTVRMDGQIAPLGASPEKEVFAFMPVQVNCEKNGATAWHPGESSPYPRYLYQVRDQRVYQEAMTRALETLMSWL